MGRRARGVDDREQNPGFPAALGRTIKVMRTDVGMSRRELAERAGISYSYITEIENGNKPPSSTVLDPIARALGLRMSQLIEAAEARLDTREAQAQDAQEILPLMEAASFALRAEAPALAGRSFAYSLRPSLRARNQEVRAAIVEIERLLRDMAPEDVERLLDYARRLAR